MVIRRNKYLSIKLDSPLNLDNIHYPGLVKKPKLDKRHARLREKRVDHDGGEMPKQKRNITNVECVYH